MSSSPNPEDSSNRLPLQKKRKASSENVAPDAAVTADSTSNNGPAAAADEPATQGQLAALQAQLVALQAQQTAQGEEIAGLKSRMNNMVGVFAPTTQHALFETAVHMSVDKVLPAGFPESEKGKAKHSVTSICSKVMTNLLTWDARTEVKFEWNGPSPTSFPSSSSPPLLQVGLHGIAGLLIYIESEDAPNLLGWDPSQRNKTVHNGEFLDSLFKTPQKQETSNKETYSATNNEVKKKRAVIAEKVEGVAVPKTVEDAVSEVAAALKAKTDYQVSETAKTIVIHKLKKILNSGK